MSIAVGRQLGGTSVLWGGRCVPFDPIDFESRPWLNGIAWPIPFDETRTHWAAAADLLRIGPPIFSAKVQFPESTPLAEGFEDSEVIASTLERWSLPVNFATEYAKKLNSHAHLQVHLGITAAEIEFHANGTSVSKIIGIRKDLRRFFFSAKHFVVAAGGLATARLLLSGSKLHPNGIGNASGVLGRYYMGHLSGKIADIIFFGDPSKTKYGFERSPDGIYCRRRITLSAQTQRSNTIANTAFWLDNPILSDASHQNGVLSMAYLALSTPIVSRLLANNAIRLSATRSKGMTSISAHLANIMADPMNTAAFLPSFLVRRYFQRRRIPGFFLPNRSNVYALHFHAEHAPNINSYVKLSKDRDLLGIPKLDVHICFEEKDAVSVIKAHRILDDHLQRKRIGRLRYKSTSPLDSVLETASDGFHQIGIARLSEYPQNGVVNSDLLVHGSENLYVVGSAVFPTSSQANPTFMAVVLAVRLAEHLKGRLL